MALWKCHPHLQRKLAPRRVMDVIIATIDGDTVERSVAWLVVTIEWKLGFVTNDSLGLILVHYLGFICASVWFFLKLLHLPLPLHLFSFLCIFFLFCSSVVLGSRFHHLKLSLALVRTSDVIFPQKWWTNTDQNDFSGGEGGTLTESRPKGSKVKNWPKFGRNCFFRSSTHL